MSKKDNKKDISGLSKRFLLAMEMVGYTGYRLEKEIDIISQPIIAHIRAGRNEPSMPIVLAFLKKFPSINGHWLLTGLGSPMLELNKDDQHEGSSFEHILHGIPVAEIVSYLKNNETARGFDKIDAYNLFLEIRTQRKLLEKMKALEEKVNGILKNQTEK